MPSKPAWTSRIPEILDNLSASPEALDRRTIQELLEVSPRRAQQLMAVVGAVQAGRSSFVNRADFELYLRSEGGPELVRIEKERRKKLAQALNGMRREAMERPRVLVELPPETVVAIRRQDFSALPEGICLDPGRICVTFTTPEEALQKLMALALAIGRNLGEFEERVQVPKMAS